MDMKTLTSSTFIHTLVRSTLNVYYLSVKRKYRVVVMETRCPWCGASISVSPSVTKFCPVCRMPIIVKVVKGAGGTFSIVVQQDRRPSRARR